VATSCGGAAAVISRAANLPKLSIATVC
jgi:hypothetical protein